MDYTNLWLNNISGIIVLITTTIALIYITIIIWKDYKEDKHEMQQL